MVDPLGTWGESKPSDGLGIKFPQYSYFDMVAGELPHAARPSEDRACSARYRRFDGWPRRLMSGVFMHPEFVSALMPIGGTTQSDARGSRRQLDVPADDRGDPVPIRFWQATHGDYYNLPKEKHPGPGVAFGWSVLGLPAMTSLSAPRRASIPYSLKCSTGPAE